MFWLKQNFICSDRILTFGIRSRFNLRRDGDLVWPTWEPLRIRSHGGFGWRHRPALPPSLPYEPGHGEAKSWGRERLKRYLRRNERFRRNVIQYFQEIIQTTFQNVETYPNHQPWQPIGRRRMVGERTRKHGPRTSLQVVSSDMSRRAGPGKTRAGTATTQNRWKAARSRGAPAPK